MDRMTYLRIGVRVLTVAAVLAGCLAFADDARAARLFFVPAAGPHPVGAQFKVQVRLDTEGQSVNAGEIKLNFLPTSVFRVAGVSRAGSIFSLWVQEPAFSNSSGTISMTGGTPSGVTTASGLVATVTFEGKAVGQGTLSMAGSSQVLLNDGSGTLAALRSSPASYTISAAAPAVSRPPQSPSASPSGSPTSSGEPVPAENTDPTPPEQFQIFLASDPTVFNGQWYVVFYTIDSGSGIEHYELREVRVWNWLLRLFGRGISPAFRISKVPYLLSDQSLWSTITVRAYDFSGNTRDAVLRPYLLRVIVWLGILLAVAALTYMIIRWRKRKRSRRVR